MFVRSPGVVSVACRGRYETLELRFLLKKVYNNSFLLTVGKLDIREIPMSPYA